MITINKLPQKLNHKKINIIELDNLFDSKTIPLRIICSLITTKEKPEALTAEDFAIIKKIKTKYFADIKPEEKQYSQKIYHRLMTEARFKKIPTDRKTLNNNTACDYVIQLA